MGYRSIAHCSTSFSTISVTRRGTSHSHRPAMTNGRSRRLPALFQAEFAVVLLGDAIALAGGIF